MSKITYLFVALLVIIICVTIIESIYIYSKQNKTFSLPHTVTITPSITPSLFGSLHGYSLDGVKQLSQGDYATGGNNSIILFIGQLVNIYKSNSVIYADIAVKANSNPKKFVILTPDSDRFLLVKQDTYRFAPLSSDTKQLILNSQNIISTLKPFKGNTMIFSVLTNSQTGQTSTPAQKTDQTSFDEYLTCGSVFQEYIAAASNNISLSCTPLITTAQVYVKTL